MDIDQITIVLSQVIHPEYKSDIVTLGMVDALEVTEDRVKFNLLTKRANDPLASSVKRSATQLIVDSFPQYQDKVTIITKEPTPKSKTKKPVSNSETNHGIKNVIAISSGKGGVGKSTVTASLAVTLAKRGYKVGVLDADIYGPSMPMMFGVEGYIPLGVEGDSEGDEMIIPAESHGVSIMSIGFFIKDSDALVWRGPMATNALRQLIHQTAWGELDYLLIDLPPGTGDIHLSIISELKLTGAIIVSTPQNIALADVVRGINMFRAEKVNVPVLGLIENMAWFTPEELPDNKYYIFGKGGCANLAKKENISLLAEIPLVQSVREGGDDGTPYVLKNKSIDDIYNNLINKLILQ